MSTILDTKLTKKDEQLIQDSLDDSPEVIELADTGKVKMAVSPMNAKLKMVNQILQSKEPADVSVDTYSGYSGYKPQYIIDAMNAIFGIGTWGFEEISNTIETVQSERGPSMLAVAQVKVWIEGVKATPVGYGQSRVTKGDIGDAKKGAQTDALKKALSYFSIGNRAYHGLLQGYTVKGGTV